MTEPKLLAQMTVPTGGLAFAGNDGAPFVGTIPAGDYDSILEYMAALVTAINTAAGIVNFLGFVSADGFVQIVGDGAWSVTWGGTADALSAALGYAESEAVYLSGGFYYLDATSRHDCAFYSPVGVDYDIDRLVVPCREQEPEDGTLIQYSSSQEHTYRDITFGLLSMEATSEGGSGDDGYGGSVDWTDRTLRDFWLYVRNRPWRFYPNRNDGTVASPGSEGTQFVTCRRMGNEWNARRRDPADWAFWDVTMRTKVTGE